MGKLTENMNETIIEGEETLEICKTDDIYPGANIKISKMQHSVFELKRKFEDEKRGDLIIDPEFQRLNVWNQKQKSELIESVLMNIPIPIIYLFERVDGKKDIVDGKQRLTTLFDFMNDKFSLQNLKMLPHLNNKKFSDLEPKLQTLIEDYQIMAYVIQPPTPERVKYDIFDRVNRGGTVLNNQEMRNALYSGKSTKLLKELAELEEFKKATGYSIKPDRMKDRYLILRFIAFYLLNTKRIDCEYKSNIDDFLACVMEWLNKEAPDAIFEELKEKFIKAMKISIELFDGNDFRFASKGQNKRPINMALFESLSFLYANIDLSFDREKLKNSIVSIKEDFDRTGICISNVDSTNNVFSRFDAIKRIIDDQKD